jgi:predicted dehydrogenase
MNEVKLRVGVVGCGVISDAYARDMGTFPEIELVGVTDLLPERAEKLASKYDCRLYPTLADMLADEAMDLVVNLTIHHAHYLVTRQCLEAGKHVHSEKPLAMTYEEAKELVELAHQRGLRLSASPFTVMGEAQQTAWKFIREGKLGTVRVVYAEVNWGRIEVWHPEPQPFYEVGALFDVGVYPISILTAMFGPAQKVWAFGTLLKPDRVTKRDVPYRIETPDFMVTMLEMANGIVVRLTTNFYVSQQSQQTGIEFHGDAGSLYLASWHMFNSEVKLAEFDKPYEPVPLVREAFDGLHWGYSLRDMAHAIADGRPHRASGEQAAHVVEIVCAATKAMETNSPVTLTSTFTPPEPMEWAA